MAKLSQAQVVAAIEAAGIKLFRERSGFPLSQAQRNLEGRTTYVDESADVKGAYVLDEGLLYGIVVKHEGKFLPVFFDLFGNIVATVDEGKEADTFRQANTMFWEMSDELDALDLTIKGVKTKQNYLQEEIDKLADLARTLK
jgi:hypothetical protein